MTKTNQTRWSCDNFGNNVSLGIETLPNSSIVSSIPDKCCQQNASSVSCEQQVGQSFSDQRSANNSFRKYPVR